ncbi:MAG TPA: hypothetical protein VEL07_10810 [Planctomycetota bacterium]|nr:hypothetical protein [Planctomycetota bacterium]
MTRRGTVLVVVAGLAALLAAIGLAFIMRVREDSAEINLAVREAQARLMLMAACTYVLESGRIGYDVDPQNGAAHEEGFGWIDVRAIAPQDQPYRVGPRDQDRRALFSPAPAVDGDGDGVAERPAWPAIGGVARCPMHRLRRPPYAIAPTAVYNPIGDDGLPLLAHPDPQPGVGATWPASPAAPSFADFVAGDPRPIAGSTGQAWFRCHRQDEALFVLTCGAGATQGFASWDEVVGAGATDEFGGDQRLFADVMAAEIRRWYRIEWSAAVGSVYDFHFVDNEIKTADHYLMHPHNATQCMRGRSVRSQVRRPNCCGTIRWVEHLETPPARW